MSVPGAPVGPVCPILPGLWTAILPVPPSANRYWRSWRGRVVRTQEAEAYCQTVGALVRHPRRVGWPALGGVAVAVRWYRAKVAGDLDNRLKVALDALQGILYHDDAQVRELHAYLDDGDRQHPRLELVAWPAGVYGIGTVLAAWDVGGGRAGAKGD